MAMKPETANTPAADRRRRWNLIGYIVAVAAYLAVAAYNMGPTKLAKARRENPNLSGVELVEKFAPSETVRYCRAILGERDLKLPAGEPASR